MVFIINLHVLVTCYRGVAVLSKAIFASRKGHPRSDQVEDVRLTRGSRCNTVKAKPHNHRTVSRGFLYSSRRLSRSDGHARRRTWHTSVDEKSRDKDQGRRKAPELFHDQHHHSRQVHRKLPPTSIQLGQRNGKLWPWNIKDFGYPER